MRISRGQKITIVYWIGQNTVEEGSTLDITSEGTEVPATEPTVTENKITSATSEEDITTNDSKISSDEQNTRQPSSTSESVNARDGDEVDVTESLLQFLSTEVGITPDFNLVNEPKFPLSSSSAFSTSTSPLATSALNTNELPEDNSTESATEFKVSGRQSNVTSSEEKENSSNDESSTQESSTLETLETDALHESSTSSNNVAGRSDDSNNDLNSTNTEEHSTVEPPADDKLNFRDGSETITEVEYWSTTPSVLETKRSSEEYVLEERSSSGSPSLSPVENEVSDLSTVVATSRDDKTESVTPGTVTINDGVEATESFSPKSVNEEILDKLNGGNGTVDDVSAENTTTVLVDSDLTLNTESRGRLVEDTSNVTDSISIDEDSVTEENDNNTDSIHGRNHNETFNDNFTNTSSDSNVEARSSILDNSSSVASNLLNLSDTVKIEHTSEEAKEPLIIPESIVTTISSSEIIFPDNVTEILESSINPRDPTAVITITTTENNVEKDRSVSDEDLDPNPENHTKTNVPLEPKLHVENTTLSDDRTKAVNDSQEEGDFDEMGGISNHSESKSSLPEDDPLIESGRKIEDFPQIFNSGKMPILIPLPEASVPMTDDRQDATFIETFELDKPNPTFVRRPTENYGDIPLPPPYFLQFPSRSLGFKSPYALENLPKGDASSPLGSPRESPVHYVSVLRPPNGILPIRSLRMIPTTDKETQNRSKRSINSTSCEWVFKVSYLFMIRTVEK